MPKTHFFTAEEVDIIRTALWVYCGQIVENIDRVPDQTAPRLQNRKDEVQKLAMSVDKLHQLDGYYDE